MLNKKTVAFSMLMAVAFIAALYLITFLRYGEPMDPRLFLQVYLAIVLTGLAAIALRQFVFGLLLYLGALIGLAADCAITFLQGGRPTMLGGVVNTAAVALAAVAGAVLQIIASRRARENGHTR